MATAHASPNLSPGSTFATRDGPWAQYLEKLQEDQWNPDAQDLLKHYRRLLWDVEQPTMSFNSELGDRLFQVPAVEFAQILDISLDNTVSVWSSLTFAQLHDQRTQAVEVDRFIDGLHTCGSDVQCRILIMNSDYFDLKYLHDVSTRVTESEHDKFEQHSLITQDLLIAHILGIEYEVKFADVYRRLQQVHSGDVQAAPFCGLGYTYKDIMFDSPASLALSSNAEQLFRAYRLG